MMQNIKPVSRMSWRHCSNHSWFWLLLAAAIYGPFIQRQPGLGSVESDLAAIESLVERRTFYINDSPFGGTIDRFRVRITDPERGLIEDRYFSHKSPVFHLAGASIYGMLYVAGLRLTTDPAPCLWALTFIMVVLPMGWLLWLIFDHPWVRGLSRRGRWGLTLSFALGSLATPFATTLNHYVPAAACLMMAMRILSDHEQKPPGMNGRLGPAVGFWISASLVCDVPPAFLAGAVIAAAWIVVTIKSRSSGRLGGLVAGATPLLLLYGALNLTIFGSPLPANLHDKQMQYHEGSYWGEFKARAEQGRPTFYQTRFTRRLCHAALGHRGVYWMMPLLIPASLAALWLTKRRARGWQLCLLLAGLPLVTIGITAWWALDLGGGSHGIRHVIATIAPLLCVLAHPALPPWRPLLKGVLVMLGLWGGLIAGIGLINPWSNNTMSAYPPLENLARFCLRHPDHLPIGWIPRLIESTSVEPATGWLDLGLDHQNHNRLDEAENALRHAVYADPENTLAYYILGIVQDQQGNSDQAIKTYRKLLQREPQNIGALNNFGRFALRAGRLGLAEQSYRRCLEFAPQDPSAMWGMLVLEELRGRADPDSLQLREALRIHPDDPYIQKLARRWRGETPD